MTRPCVVIEVGDDVCSIPLDQFWTLSKRSDGDASRVVLFAEDEPVILYSGTNSELATTLHRKMKMMMLEVMKGITMSPLVLKMGDLSSIES